MRKRNVAFFMILIIIVHYSVDDVIGKFGGKRSEVRVEESSNNQWGEVYSSTRELVHASENIIKTKILEMKRKTEGDGSVFLYVKAVVLNVYKGDIEEEEITVRNRVGYKRDGEEHLVSLGYENLGGEEVIFFLNGNNSGEYETISSMQGMLKLPKRGGMMGIKNGDFNMFYNKRVKAIERNILRFSRNKERKNPSKQ